MIENQKNTIGKAAGIVGALTLLSRLMGMYRDRIFASSFGAGDVLDVYYASFRIPDFIFNLLILGTLSVAFIPVFTEYFYKDKEQANKIANTILNVSFVGIGILCLVLLFFVPQLTSWIAPGFQGEKFDQAVMLTRIFLISPIIFTLSSVFGSILNSLKKFFLVALAPILYNLGIIFGAKFLYPSYGIRGLAYGVIIGALLHLLIQLFGLMKSGFRYSFSWDLRHPGVLKVFKLFAPRIIGLDASQVSLLIASIIGSTLMSGSIAVFNLANNLQAVPLGIFAISFAIAAFPNLSEASAKGDDKEFNHILVKTTANILFFVLPISVLMIVMRAQIVRLILGAGAFDWQATKFTANALGVFAISIFAQSLIPLFSRAFYAKQNTVIPVVVGIFAMIANACASYIFGKQYGVLGLVAGFSISSIIQMFILFILLHSRLKHLDDKFLSYSIVKIVFASFIAGAVSYISLNIVSIFITLDTVVNLLVQAIIASGLGIFSYFAVSAGLGLQQSGYAIKVVKEKIFG